LTAGTSQAWFALGVRHAFGGPILVMIAAHIGFGAIAQAAGISSWAAVFSTVAIWALPGQLVVVESWALGASLFAIVPAAMLTGTRFLPMTVALMPLLRHPRHRTPHYYAAAHLLSMVSWAALTPRIDAIPASERLAYFLGFASCCWTVSMASVAAGFHLAGAIPRDLQMGFVLLTPINFFLMLTGDVRHRAGRLALAFGAVAGPLLHMATPRWGLLLTGLLAGTAAFLLDRRLARRG